MDFRPVGEAPHRYAEGKNPRCRTGGAVKRKIFGRLAVSFGVVCWLAACNLPFSSTPTKFQFPTPNWTMSKLFELPTMNPDGSGAAAGTGTPGIAGPTATISPTAPDCTNKAEYVGESVPDLTYKEPGTAFIKTWTLKNVGTCTWGRGYALVFDHGDRMDAPDTVPLTAGVQPGAIYVFSVNLTAPADPGQYQGFWMLQTPQLVKFGLGAENKAFWVKITTTQQNLPCAGKDARPEENGGTVEAYYTSTAPAIDGSAADWPDAMLEKVPYAVVGSTDNRAKFALRWNNTYLFLIAIIEDADFSQETSGGANLYKGDSIEILFDRDLKLDYCSTTMDADDYQLGISPGWLASPTLQPPTAYLWYPVGKKGAKDIAAVGAYIFSPSGYILEAQVPWSIFGGPLIGGQFYGFAFSVVDWDHPGLGQDGMLSTSPQRTYPTNPMLWGTLRVTLSSLP
jgi:hypothetical protein